MTDAFTHAPRRGRSAMDELRATEDKSAAPSEGDRLTPAAVTALNRMAAATEIGFSDGALHGGTPGDVLMMDDLHNRGLVRMVRGTSSSGVSIWAITEEGRDALDVEMIRADSEVSP